MSPRLWAAAALLAVSLSACERRPQGNAAAPTDSRSSAQSPRAPDAERTLALFLDRSVGVTPSARGTRDSLQACPPDGMIDPIYTLATFQVLASSLEGDSAQVSAEVTTVAEERTDSRVYDRRVATVRIATDTFSWRLIRDGAAGWKVCGTATGGYDFGHYGNDAKTTWTPRAATWEKVQALVDSLRQGG